jgi:hypothetical protein
MARFITTAVRTSNPRKYEHFYEAIEVNRTSGKRHRWQDELKEINALRFCFFYSRRTPAVRAYGPDDEMHCSY